MRNLLFCELKKFKRKKFFYAAFIAAFVFPILNAALIAGTPGTDFASMSSSAREDSGFLLLMPLLILLAANLFFSEQDHDTLKNLLCIPVSKNLLVLVKLLVLLIFSVVFQLVGFVISTLMSILYKISLVDLILQFALTVSTGILLWAAALPCVFLVLWFNKSYLLSVIIVFFYTLANYILHFSDTVLMQPLGLNAGTLMPIPMIFRWLYQFNIPSGEIQTAFYNRFAPFFASTPECFAVLLLEAAVCIALMLRLYQCREV